MCFQLLSIIQASDAMEHGKWMKVLIEQTNMASQSLEATQDEEFDEIYDNVAEDNVSCPSDRGRVRFLSR